MAKSAAVVAGFTTTLGAVGAAVCYLAANSWFGSGDLPAMVFWSAPLGGLVAMAVRMLSPLLDRARRAWRFAAFAILGGILGYLWTVAVALILGGWIAAFSFPVLFCWMAGGILGGTAAALVAQPRSWPIAALITGATVVLLLRVNAYALAPEPRVRVVLRPRASAREVERAWTEVVGRPTGRGSEQSLLPGITGVGASDYEGESAVLTVSFDKRLSSKERGQLIAGFLRSPLVVRVDSVLSAAGSGVRPSVSY
jgi:hypothetical protein